MDPRYTRQTVIFLFGLVAWISAANAMDEARTASGADPMPIALGVAPAWVGLVKTFAHPTRGARILEPAEGRPDFQVGSVIRELDLTPCYPEGSQQVIGTTAAPGRVAGDLLARACKGR